MAGILRNNNYNIAIVGGGLSGMAAAWLLGQSHKVTLFEAAAALDAQDSRVEISTSEGRAVVGGSMVIFNDHANPNLSALFKHIDIPTTPADLSVSVSLDHGGWEFCNGHFQSLLINPVNLLRPSLWAIANDLIHFQFEAAADLGMLGDMKLYEYLARQHYGRAFQERYLLPMIGALLSVSPQVLLHYSAEFFLRFCADIGILKDRLAYVWQTVEGGGSAYGARLLKSLADRVYLGTRVAKLNRTDQGVLLCDANGQTEAFDHVILATPADAALALLDDASEKERALLNAFQYRQNTALLHTDQSLMPRRKSLWAGANYREGHFGKGTSKNFCLTYWMNRLQKLPGTENVFVTLDPGKPLAPEKILHKQINRRPILNAAAIVAQTEIEAWQGQRNTWFCGGYFGAGLHEDSVAAGLNVAEMIGPLQRPWAA